MGNRSSIPGGGSSGKKRSGKKTFGDEQVCVVACHDERADSIEASTKGERWKSSEDFNNWPYDPPLSDSGVRGAQETAQQLVMFLVKNVSQIHVIICSPSLRCVQTAAYFSFVFHSELNHKPHLIIDQALGDIYGPSTLGRDEPIGSLRPMAEKRRQCPKVGVKWYDRVCGKSPAWPESLRDARKRAANRFLSHLKRGTETKTNVMFVTHADGVGAALKLMPSEADSVTEQVGRGGFFFAKRKMMLAEDGQAIPAPSNMFNPVTPDNSPNKARLHAEGDPAIFDDTPPPTEHAEADTDFDDLNMSQDPMIRQESPESQCTQASAESAFSYKTNSGDAPMAKVELPQLKDGWQVKTVRIKTKKIRSALKMPAYAGYGNSGVQNIGASAANEVDAKIDQILSELPDRPLAYDWT